MLFSIKTVVYFLKFLFLQKTLARERSYSEILVIYFKLAI